MPTDRVDEIMGEWREEAERGRHVDPQALLESHPEHAKELADRFAAQALVDHYYAEADSLPLVTPERIGDYRIVGEIGRGGMGVVYEAVQESMERRVALKVLYPTIATTVRTMKRFEREARVTGRLHHTNIVTVYAMGQDDGYVYFAMELIEGQPLDKVIEHLGAQERGEPTAEPTQRLASDLCGRGRFERLALKFAGVADALHVAHAHAVVHRDVKPSNLVLDGDGDLKLTDFGLAQLVGEDFGVTRTGEVLGTPMYMSPEQVRARREEVDQRTDVYSLGATLYELLTLTPPHGGKDIGSLCSQILSEEPRPLHSVSPNVPRDLATIVHKALQKERGDRYASAGKMAADLRAFAEGRSISARPLGVALRIWRAVKRRPVRSALTAIVLFLVAAGWWLKVDADLARARARAVTYERTLAEANEAATFVAALGSWDPGGGRFGRAPLRHAEILFARAITLNPRALEPWLSRALLQGRAGEDCLSDLEEAAARGLSPVTVELARRFIKRDLDAASSTTRGEGTEFDGQAPLDHFLRGWSLMIRGRRDLAVRMLSRALDELPPHHNARRISLQLRALASEHEGDWAVALEDYSALRELSPNAPFVRVLLANAWKKLGHPEQAASTFQAALTLARDAADESSWKSLTLATEITKELTWVESVHEAAVAAQPHSPLLLAKAAKYFAIGAPERAQVLMNQSLGHLGERHPDDLEVRKCQAAMLQSLGRPTEALGLLEELLHQHPGDPDLLFSVGAQVSDQDPSRSDRLLRQALTLQPGNHLVCACLCMLSMRRGQFDEAERLVKKGLKLTPRSVSLHRVLSRLHIFRGEWDKALAVIDQGLSRLPGYPTLLYARAQALNNLGRYAEALVVLDDADGAPHRIAKNPGRHYLRGYALEMSGRPEEALAAYEAYGAENSGVQVQLTQARVLRRLDRMEAAAKALDLALALKAHGVHLLNMRALEAIEQRRLEPARRDIDELLRQAPKHPGALALDRVLKAIRGELVVLSPEDHLAVAGFMARTSPRKAFEHMMHALESEKLRADLRQGHLYNAACFAMLSLEEVKRDEERAQLVTNALNLLREWRDRWHQALEVARDRGDKAVTSALETKWSRELNHARHRDPDLEPLRDLPTFKSLFGASDARPAKRTDESGK